MIPATAAVAGREACHSAQHAIKCLQAAPRLWWSGHPHHRTATKLRIFAGTGREPKVELAVA